jgi:hypothetical protein
LTSLPFDDSFVVDGKDPVGPDNVKLCPVSGGQLMNPVLDSKLAAGIILPSEKTLGSVARQAKQKFSRVHPKLVLGLQEAVSVGRDMESKGVDVIISRRGAAELLRENLRIPVLALMADPLDILIRPPITSCRAISGKSCRL